MTPDVGAASTAIAPSVAAPHIPIGWRVIGGRRRIIDWRRVIDGRRHSYEGAATPAATPATAMPTIAVPTTTTPATVAVPPTVATMPTASSTVPVSTRGRGSEDQKAGGECHSGYDQSERMPKCTHPAEPQVIRNRRRLSRRSYGATVCGHPGEAQGIGSDEAHRDRRVSVIPCCRLTSGRIARPTAAKVSSFYRCEV